MVELTKRIPCGAHDRLVDHYGTKVNAWLQEIEEVIVEVAECAKVSIDGFYDAGWASIVAVGRYPQGERVILKAFPESDRYFQQRAALAH